MARQEFHWTRKHEDCLLGHLEFVIHKFEKANYRKAPKREILRMLEDELPHPKPTKREIERRLTRIWKTYNSNTSKWYCEDDIYLEGKLALSELDEARVAAIVSQFEILKTTQEEIDKSTPRKIRSGRELGIHQAGDKQVVGTPTPTKSKREQPDNERRNGQLSKRPKVDQLCLKSPSRKPMVVISRLEERNPRLSPPTSALKPKSKSKSKSKSRSKSRSSTVNTSEPMQSIRPSVESVWQEESPDANSTQDDRGHEILLEPFIRAASKSKAQLAYQYGEHKSDLTDINDDFVGSKHDLILDLFNDNWHLRRELEVSENERKAMAENHRVRQLVQQTSLSSALQEQSQTIARNQMLINDHQFARHFLNGNASKNTTPHASRIVCIHEDMERNILDFSTEEHTLYTVDCILSVKGEDFSFLRDQVLSGNRKNLNDKPLPLEVWVQSFIGAAVYQWVFAQSYKGVAVMSTPLLHAYRRALRMFCPEDFMTLIESVAHQCLVDNDHFKQVFLQRSAEMYATRLCTALDPLIKGEPLPSGYNFDEELAGIFLSALEIKMLGMTPKSKYECTWPSRDTEFDCDLMTRFEQATSTDKQRLGHRKVLLTLVPGIKACGVSAGSEQELVEFELIARARVFTGEAS